MATFADYLASGSGAVAFRLVIEGCPYEFVTDPVMEGAIGDGRYRARGLQADQLSIDESAYMAGAELNLKLSSVQITETDGPYRDAATVAFSGFSSGSTLAFLSAGMSAGDGVATVGNAGPLTVNQVVHIGTAAWRIDSITRSGTTAPDTIHMTEGMWRTTPQGFAVSTATSTDPASPLLVRLTSAPANYAGRRVWLYGHGLSELGTGSAGTVLWRGLLATNPELSDSQTWSLSMQPRLSLFDAQIGKAAGGATRLRGIYYSAVVPMSLYFNLRTGPNSSDASSAHVQIWFYGFFETQLAFCAALESQLNADPTLSTWGGTWSVRPTDVGTFGPFSGGWDLYYTPGATPKWVDVAGGSGVDGGFSGHLIRETIGGGGVTTVAASTEYRCDWQPTHTTAGSGRLMVPATQCRQVPRACYNPLGAAGGTTRTAQALWPLKRFYLDFSAGVGSWGSVKIQPPTPDGSTTAPAEIDAPVAVYAAGYIQINDATVTFPGWGASGPYQPTFALSTLYGPITSPTGCTFAQFMQAIVDNAPNTANVGAPFITADDVAIATWTSEIAAASSGVTALQRRLYSFAKPQKLIDVVKEECKLHGVYPCLDVDGKIIVRRLPASGSTVPSLTIDSTVHTPGDDFGKFKLAPDGIISSIEMKSGYSSIDDNWLNTWNFDSPQSAATTKSKGQQLVIAPFAKAYASDRDGGDIPLTDAANLVKRVLALFGAQYYYVDVPVSIIAHTKRIGDELLVTVAQLPFGGARTVNTPGSGMVNIRAFVVGRRWNYGSDPTGVLTLLVEAANTGGYAPTLRIASVVGGSGTAWTFATTPDFYGPRRVDASAPADATFYATGYRVVLREFDADSPALYTGVVTAVTGNNVSITFDVAFPGLGSSTWDLAFDVAQNATVGQQAYVYMGDPTGRITFGTGAVSPRDFA